MSAHPAKRRHAPDEATAEVARRRLAALSAELAASRGELAPPRRAAEDGADPEPAAADPASPDGDPAATPHQRRPSPALGRLVGWTADRLPAGLHQRAHLGSAQVGVVCLVVAVGLVLGAVWLVRAGGDAPGEVVPPRPAAASSSTGPVASPSADPAAATSAPASPGTAGAATAAPGGEIIVDVVGKVRHPGIAVLPAGSRVADAVTAAGGLSKGVDRKLVNLARVLVDGEQIVVGEAPDPGAPPAPVAGSAAASSGGLVNLNTADQAGLESLPGVGPVTAAAILEWRTRNGAFTAVEELLEVDGIGDVTLAKITPHVTL